MSEVTAPKRKRKPADSVQAVRPSRDSPSLTSLGFLLHLALRKLSDGVAEALVGSGIHPGHLAVLGALNDRGAMSQRRLGEITRIEKSSMVLFLDALEEGAWVRRVPDPEDRRAYRVELTKQGTARFARLGPKMKAVQDAFMASLAPEEQAQLFALLTRVGGTAPPDHPETVTPSPA